MAPNPRRLAAFAIAFVSFAFSACNSGPDVIFVREDLTLDGNPRQILRLAEPVETDVFYYDGEKWVLAEDVEIPAGWDCVTPAVVNSAIAEPLTPEN